MSVFVLDSGYGGNNPTITGDKVDGYSHGTMLCDIVRVFNPKTQIHSVKVPESGSLDDISITLENLRAMSAPNDVILIGWITHKNQTLDDIMYEYLHDCTVVIPAGNYCQDISNYSPMLPHFHIVEAYNSHNNRMSSSNYGEGTTWMYGVPIHHLNLTQRGTSLASAIYTGLLSRSKSEKFMRRARRVLYNMFNGNH